MLRPKALIIGISGQDGSYLAEFLLNKGYEVHGLIRRSSSLKRERIDHISDRFLESGGRFFLHYGDLHDESSLYRILKEVAPDEVYNLGAQSHVRISFDTPVGTSEVVGIGAIRLLEAVKNLCPEVKFYQASSSEMFGSFPPPQNEKTPFHPRSPYATSKLYAHWSAVNYREGYKIFAVNGILFNHESPRRGENFVTKKIAMGAVAISKDKHKKLHLGNIQAIRDWGYAPEYVEAMWLMLQRDRPLDFVIGTGYSATVEDFLEWCFKAVDLNWQDHVVFDKNLLRPNEVDSLIADPISAQVELKWSAKVHSEKLAQLMVDAELRRKSDLHLVVDPWIFGEPELD